jgi:hypothetical protein
MENGQGKMPDFYGRPQDANRSEFAIFPGPISAERNILNSSSG